MLTAKGKYSLKALAHLATLDPQATAGIGPFGPILDPVARDDREPDEERRVLGVAPDQVDAHGSRC